MSIRKLAFAIAVVLLINIFSVSAQVTAQENKSQSPFSFEFPDYYKDPNVISDENFFGKWEAETLTWAIEPYLNYKDFPDLSDVETKAKAGEYDEAKSLLRKYYLRKFSTYARADKNGSYNEYLEFLLYKHNILYTWSACSLRGELTAQPEWGWIETDVSYLKDKDLSIPQAYFFVSLTKEDTVIEMKSRETGDEFAPRIEAMVNGQLRIFPAIQDTYISAGSNNKTTFGHEDKLLTSESTSSIGNEKEPVDENTYRTYIMFDLSSIQPTDTVDSFTLKVYARNANGTSPRGMIALECFTTTWTEDNLIWSKGQIQHSIYSWHGEEGPTWNFGTHDNAFFRMSEDPIRFANPSLPGNIGYYQNTGDLEGIYQAARMMTHFIYKQPDPTWRKSLDAACRGEYFPEYLAFFVEHEDVVPDDVWVGILKYCWKLGEYLNTVFSTNNNWGFYETKGLFNISQYFEEFSISPTWLSNAYKRFERLNTTNIFNDGTSVEQPLSYASGTATDVLWPGEQLEILGKDPSELNFPESYDKKVRALAKFIMDVTGPGFCDTQKGDSAAYTSIYTSKLKSIGKTLGEPYLLWAGTGGREGEVPDYKSVYYPDGHIAIMRSDWTNDALYLQTYTHPDGYYSHRHYDTHNIIMFAYGKYLLADPLFYTLGDGGDLRNDWLKSSMGHNTVVVNDTNHKADCGSIDYWETNDGFDFISQKSQAYNDIKYSREILFIKNKFYIVTDFLDSDDNSTSRKYEQFWHFLPSANAKMDTETFTIETGFSDANIKIVPVVTDDYASVNDYDSSSSGIKSGYYGGGNLNITNADYASYIKNMSGDVTFNTILFPVNSQHNYDVSTEKLNTELNPTQAAAVKIQYVDKNTDVSTTGIYYNLLDKTLLAERVIDNYLTDGQMLYVEKTDEKNNLETAFLTNGKHIFDRSSSVEILKSKSNLDNVSVRWKGSAIYIDSMNEIELDDLTVYSDGKTIKTVEVNGEAVVFNQQGRYIFFGDEPIIEDRTYTESETTGTQTNKHGNSGDGGSSGGSGSSSGSESSSGSGSTGDSEDGNSNQDESLSPAPEEISFKDVSKDRWSYEYIKYLAEKGIVNGVGENKFEPERSITREEFVKLIIEGFGFNTAVDGKTAFKDVPEESWYSKYIKTAAELGLIRGMTEKRFGVGETITREDMATIVARVVEYFNYKWQTSEEKVTFTDAEKISDYAMDAVISLAEQGILTGGDNGQFSPKDAATREQTAKIIYLVLEMLEMK